MQGYPRPPGATAGAASSSANAGSIVPAPATVAEPVNMGQQVTRRDSGRDSRPSALAQSVASSGGSESGKRGSQRGVHFSESATHGLQSSTGVLFSDHPSVMESKSNIKIAAEPNSANKMPLTLKELTSELNNLSPVFTDQHHLEVKQALDALQPLLQLSVQECSLRGTTAAPGRLLTVGAYQLGVAAPGDDIDLVFVAPPHIQLQDFGAVLRKVLLQHHLEACKIRNALHDGSLMAPGLKFSWRGVNLNVLFALEIHDLPLASGEGGIVQSTAGTLAHEVGQTLLSCVPNLDQYRLLLRFVRFWAKQRGVYGSIFGYFSGTAWAICCAHACQQNPKAQLPQLVGHFFRILGRWDWSTPLAVLSSDQRPGVAAEVPPPPPDTRFAHCKNCLLEWTVPEPAGGICPTCQGPVSDGQAPGQLQPRPKQALMPVLLPAGMGIVATRNVSETTMKILQKEFRRGVKTAKQVELFRVHWSDVYNSARFFSRHRHYLEFDFMASSDELFEIWLVWAKQQIENLVQLFESTSKDIVSLRPWPEFLEFKDTKWSCARAIFFGLHLERGGNDGENEQKRTSFDLREPVVKFLEATACWPEVESYRDQFELEVRHVKIDQLEQWLDNRDKGIVARGAMPPIQGLLLQNVGEKSWQNLPDPEEM